MVTGPDPGPAPSTTGAGAAEPSDADLLAAHVGGDPVAFGVLFSRHRDRLWAVALRTMSNREDAADGLQDAMVAAFRRAGSFRGDAAVTTWLHRVVVNACLDRLRASRVRAAEALPDDLEERAGRGSLVTGTTEPEGPEAQAEAAERRRLVVRALAQLPAEQRAALVLVDMEGYSVAEAAEVLECAPGTVKSRCSRGRARLATLLAMFAPVADPAPPLPGNQVSHHPVPSSEGPRGPPSTRKTDRDGPPPPPDH